MAFQPQKSYSVSWYSRIYPIGRIFQWTRFLKTTRNQYSVWIICSENIPFVGLLLYRYFAIDFFQRTMDIDVLIKRFSSLSNRVTDLSTRMVYTNILQVGIRKKWHLHSMKIRIMHFLSTLEETRVQKKYALKLRSFNIKLLRVIAYNTI